MRRASSGPLRRSATRVRSRCITWRPSPARRSPRDCLSSPSAATWSARAWCSRRPHDSGAAVVFGGSFRVYGDDLDGSHRDEDAPYGRVGDLSHLSKVYVEQLARMIGVPFVSVRLGVTYGLSPIMKTDPAFMTVPNLFCQRAVAGEALRVLEDRPLAFIHVADAAEALLAAPRCQQDPGVAGGQRRARSAHRRPGRAARAAAPGGTRGARGADRG